jgi:DNA helicase IV
VAAVVVESSGVRYGATSWAWIDVHAVTQANFLVVGNVKLTFSDGSSLTAWGWPAAARALRESVEAGVSAWAEAARSLINADRARVRAFMLRDCYLSRQHVREFVGANRSAFEARARSAQLLAARGEESARAYCELVQSFDDVVASRNAAWSREEQARWRELFDTLERSPLTAEQRKAVVDFENRNLLVAAAGSGKSSTLVAKVAYALRKGLFDPNEVLALAFNKKAADELAPRLRERLKETPGVELIRSETFHALSKRILEETQEKKQAIEGQPERRIQEAYDYLKATDEMFRRDAALFILNFTPHVRDRTGFSTFEEYEQYLRTAEVTRGAMGRRVPTLSGHMVASLEEMKITNWLFMNGVPFEYEKRYPHVEATRERRGYTPDFYYPEINVWHEHFGINAKGRPAPCVGDPEEYLAGMAWKRECHASHRTRLIETSSALFADNTIFEKLRRQLVECGQQLRELSAAEIDSRLSPTEHRNLAALVAVFISHWKTKQTSFDALMARGSPRDRAFLPICKRVFDKYAEQLTRDRRVDFDDLIAGATRVVRSGAWPSPFRLILIDEFQDISASRAELVRALLAQHDDAVLFAVGDDWQSINGFAGSELAIMRNFAREFGYHARNHLTHTFRSNQGISTAAKTFVEKNPAQLRKSVIASDKTVADSVRVVHYSTHAQHARRYEMIARELSSVGACSLRVLGRYNKNAGSVDHEMFKRVAPAVRIEFNTMHGSKGLEADYVILDRLEASGSFAFPSAVSDDSVLRLVLPEKEPFPHAEERRLMYVALTRARRRVYILARDGSESPFVTELFASRTNAASTPVDACPYCKNGTRVSREGKYGAFWSCSRFPDCIGKARTPHQT